RAFAVATWGRSILPIASLWWRFPRDWPAPSSRLCAAPPSKARKSPCGATIGKAKRRSRRQNCGRLACNNGARSALKRTKQSFSFAGRRMNQPACIETSTMSSLLDRYDVQSLDSARHPHALSLPYRHSAPAKTTGIARDRSATADESPRFVILTCEQVKRLQRQAGVMLSAACL